MKTPAFWSEPNFLSRLLKPLGAAYAFATRLRIGLGRPCKIGRPVVCIGNLTAGGTGKTPVAVAVAGLLQQAGKNPFFVSRGYGGTLKNIMVDKERHTASEVGDEPLLLARRAPVIVNPDRVAGAQKALRSGAEVIVMDDGFQNPGLYKDLSFLVFDGGFGIGNGLSQHAGKALPVKDVVAQHQAHGVVPHKLLPDDKRLRQSIGRWLLGILETHAELSAVSQQSLESGQIGRSADNKYLTNTRQHQYRYGVINHRFVINWQQLF